MWQNQGMAGVGGCPPGAVEKPDGRGAPPLPLPPPAPWKRCCKLPNSRAAGRAMTAEKALPSALAMKLFVRCALLAAALKT